LRQKVSVALLPQVLAFETGGIVQLLFWHPHARSCEGASQWISEVFPRRTAVISYPNRHLS
jgi:hypothetical protein